MKRLPRKKVESILRGFGRTDILIVGDLMRDRCVGGAGTRISPEAPVPVVEVTSESDLPGGSANVVNNVCALGGRVRVCGVIGADRIGRSLLEKLKNPRVDLAGVIVDSGRSTTLKTRIIAHSQQVVRVDRENRTPVRERDIDRILAYIRSLIGVLDAVIIKDYGKGLVTQRLVTEIVGLCGKHGVTVAVDPTKGHAIDYRGISVITPNRAEALWLAGVEAGERVDLDAVGRILLNRLACRGVLITLGDQGMRLFREGCRPIGIPTAAREVYDVSGAGDTVISAFTLALAAGASMEDAAIVGNYAAGVVVGKVGTATVSRREIIEAMFS